MNPFKAIYKIVVGRKQETFRGCAVFRLGASFEQARQELRMSHDELAARMGVSLRALKRLESGEVPSSEVFDRIVRAFSEAGEDLPACRAYLRWAREENPVVAKAKDSRAQVARCDAMR